jgi:4-hydroxyproline epimerase
VRLTNVPAFLHSTGIKTHCEGLGEITVDVAYGGNFYAIVDAAAEFCGHGRTFLPPIWCG